MKTLAEKLELPKIRVGNILSVYYLVRSRACSFKGICISLKKQRLVNKSVYLILRTVIMRIGIEFGSLMFAYNMLHIKLLIEKAKKNFWRKAKLLYLRKKVNKRSIIKFT
jgi:ribosomal protein L19